ncbi:class I SAM-dependent methyltransferase [Caulobacter sp. LjRoot300]|uniref:class I SAM-dependent methyltransferase n=1 Tax=Caulobacter sp. LjRoot300 TaxID=3342321 RepID=UPI003ED07E51
MSKHQPVAVQSLDDPNPRPRLTVSILTRNSADRLERLLAEASWFADQIVVGVDAASTDDTLEIAKRMADVVFTFRHAGAMSAARMMIFDYAVGDWILVIDDDESLEAGFAALLPELMSRTEVTHYWFPRKWIVGDAPYEFADVPPWYPDWQMRLFRNDATLVWKPAKPHSGYHVLGASYFDSRAAILHFEPVWCAPAERQAKLERYRKAGADPITALQYPPEILAPRRPASGPTVVEPCLRPGGGAVVHAEARDATLPCRAAWGCEIVRVDLPVTVQAGKTMVAAITVRNTGGLAWAPNVSARGAILGLGVHLVDAHGRETWDFGGRCPVTDRTPPGGQTTFLHVFTAPVTAGDYELVWDMVDDLEAWFQDAQPRERTTKPLKVSAPSTPEADQAFLDEIAKRVPGWLQDYAALRTMDLLRWQTVRGATGPLLEIGVYAGRYFSVLLREAVVTGELVVGLDPYERVDEATVLANLAAAGLRGGVVRLVRAHSAQHGAESLLDLLGGRPRFVSIDGSHLYDDVRHDLAICDAILAPEGIIACDDFLNPVRLDVGQAIHEHLARASDLVPFAYVQNKLFLCRKAMHPALLDAALRFCEADVRTPVGEAFARNAGQDLDRNRSQLYGWGMVTAP